MDAEIRMLLLKMALLLFLVAEAASSSTFEDPKPPRKVLMDSREAEELIHQCRDCFNNFNKRNPCCTQIYCNSKSVKLPCRWDYWRDYFEECGLEKVQCIRNHTITPQSVNDCE